MDNLLPARPALMQHIWVFSGLDIDQLIFPHKVATKFNLVALILYMNKLVFTLLFFAAFVTGLQAQPLNDDCANAIPITIPATGNVCINGNNIGATSTTWATASCGFTNWTNDVWYTFVSNGTANTITVTPTGSPAAQRIGVSVYTGTCGSLSSLGTSCQVSATNGGAVTVNQTTTAGTQFYVEVSAFNGDGNFQVCITSGTPPPSPGTTCGTATQVCDLSAFTLGTGPTGTGVYDPSCFTLGAFSSVWYSFSVGTAGSLQWSCTPSGANTELDWAVFDITNGCGTNNLNNNTISCNYNYANQTSSPIGMSTASTTVCPTSGAAGAAGETCPPATLIAGHTYAIMIDNFSANGSGWNFNWNGSTFGMAPTSSFTATPATICGSSGTVTIANASVGGVSYAWNFGDGTTSTAQNPPAHTYNAPGTYLISLVVTAGNGCTDVSSRSVQIAANPTVSVNSATVCANAPATLTATVSPTGGTYSWNTGGTASSISVTPATTTSYTVTYTNTIGCTASASGTVTVNPATFTVNAGNDVTICANQTTPLTGTVNPAGTYTYSWTPAASLTGANTVNAVASPQYTTTYTLSVTDAGGCTLSDNVVVTVSGTGPPVNATVTPSTICPGQQVQLDFTATPVNCGINYYGCNGIYSIDSAGTGYNIAAGTPTNNITTYGNFNKSIRMQMLYTAAELQAAMGTSGATISQLGWIVGVFNSTAGQQNFTIKMGCTSATSLSTWQTGLKTVFLPKTVSVPLNYTGPILHSLDSLYDWDGQSNIVVEICFYSAGTNGNLNNKVIYTNSPNMCIYSRANVDQCSIVPVATVTNERPKMVMRYCKPDYNSFAITWTPSTGLNGVSNATIKNPTAAPFSTQNYTVNVSNGTCSGSDVVTVTIDTSVKVDAGPDINYCANNAINLTATPTGSPQPGNTFQYQWRAVPAGTLVGTNNPQSVVPTGTTTYVVSMSGGLCTVYDTVRAVQASLTLSHTATNVSCNGGNNGKIKVVPVGNAPYTFTWSANAATGNIDSAQNLIAGTYYVTVTDALGCIGKDTITLTQPTAVSFTQVVTDVSCNGGSTGSIALTPSGGTGAGYTYTWSNNPSPSTATNSNLGQGNYTVTVKDGNNCSVTGSFTINQPPLLTLTISSFKDIRCFNGNDGFINVTAGGGTPGAPGYTYQWSPNSSQTTANATSLTAATYNVTVTDSKGCTATVSQILAQPASGLSLGAPAITNVSCFGSNNGSITANPTGGATPYTYLWNNGGGTNQTASGLTAQTYQLTVTDDSLCTATASYIVNQPAQIQINGTVTNVQCNGNSDAAIDITITNGLPTFTYNWNNNAYTTEDLLNIPAGTYNVTVTDNTSCTQTATYTVTQPVALTLNPAAITNVACFGGATGSITANPAGGTGAYNYTWSPGAGNTQTISSLTANTYTVTVADANSCSVTAQYQVTEPSSAITLGAATIVNLQCNGGNTGSITANPAGGTGAYTYTWSPSGNTQTISSLAAGTYIVTAYDANNCSVSASYNITQPAAIVFGASVVTNVSCAGGTDGTAQVNPAGGTGTFTYTWNGQAGPNPQTGLGANTYTVVVTDGNGCSASTSLTITAPPALLLNPTPSDALCFNAPSGSIDANPQGGTPPYTFLWSSGDATQIASGLLAGFYSVTVTDSRSCSATGAANVNQPTNLTAIITTTPVKCQDEANGTLTATMTGGTPPYSFSVTQDFANFFFPINGVVYDLAPGDYSIVYSDNNGCTNTAMGTVVDAIPDVFTITTDSTSCYGADYDDGAIHIIGLTTQNMPYQFGVDGGPVQYSGDFYNLSAGNHTIQAINNWGCPTTHQALILEPAEGVAEILPHDTTIQLGESVQLISTFSQYSTSVISSYNWSPTLGLSCIDCPNPLVTPYNRSTDFVLTITYNKNCVATATINVLVENNLPVFIPNAFTPNGDGNNDVFQIYGEGIKTVDLKIFNRWGIKVFDSTNQFSAYEADITFLDNKKIQKVGSITLVH